MEEIINQLIGELESLNISSPYSGKLLELWGDFCKSYGISNLEVYKFNNPPSKKELIMDLISTFRSIKVQFQEHKKVFINFALIHNKIIQVL